MRPEQTYTVEQFIASAPVTKIAYQELSIIEKMNNVQLVIYNVLNDYLHELNDLSVTVEFTETEYQKYVYKPKLLAYDIYGSTELYFLILYMNNICNVKEFNFRKLKMLRVDVVQSLLSSIYNSEKELILNNRYKLEEM